MVNKIYGMISAVLLRPKMYTLHGSFGEVTAFLEGYYSGTAINHMNDPSVTVWSEFLYFLCKKLEVTSSEVMHEFQNRYGSEAIDELEKAYDEFTVMKNE